MGQVGASQDEQAPSSGQHRPIRVKVALKKHFLLLLPLLRAALDRAAVLLKMSLEGLRINNHWGSGGGLRPLTQLIKEVIHRHQHHHQQSPIQDC